MATQASNAAQSSGRFVPVSLLVGTRKGAFIYRSDAARRQWRVEGPCFFGSIVNNLVLDPRDGRTLLLAATTGNPGPTVLRSLGGGRNFKEAKKCSAPPH